MQTGLINAHLLIPIAAAELNGTKTSRANQIRVNTAPNKTNAAGHWLMIFISLLRRAID